MKPFIYRVLPGVCLTLITISNNASTWPLKVEKQSKVTISYDVVVL
jgi:hypothetical protein